MNKSEIKQQLRHIADQLIDDGGVSYMQVVEAFKATTTPDDLLDLGADALDELVQNWSKAIVDEKRRAGNREVSLPGIGDFDETVTTLNAEGAYLVKHLRHATRADLLADVELHEDNVRRASEALERARHRNRRLIPVMDELDAETAGEALRYLGAVEVEQ